MLDERYRRLRAWLDDPEAVAEMTREEIRAALRAEGIDPDALTDRFRVRMRAIAAAVTEEEWVSGEREHLRRWLALPPDAAV